MGSAHTGVGIVDKENGVSITGFRGRKKKMVTECVCVYVSRCSDAPVASWLAALLEAAVILP